MFVRPVRRMEKAFKAMVTFYTGEDRVRIQEAVRGLLGTNYEVFEGDKLTPEDLPSIFQGTSLFGGETRRILLKDLGENSSVWARVPEYLQTEHVVVIWETKIDKRSAGYKALKAAGVEIVEFAEKKGPEVKLVFEIFEMAMRDGERAVRMCEQIELTQDPYMFFGLMVTQALKKFGVRQGVRERKILKELAELDVRMKTSGMEPWILVKMFLVRMGSW